MYLNLTGYSTVMTKHVGEGYYSIVSGVMVNAGLNADDDHILSQDCQLLVNTDVIGGGTEREFVPESQLITAAITMTGGATVGVAGADISVRCQGQSGGQVFGGQIMITKIAGFF